MSKVKTDYCVDLLEKHVSYDESSSTFLRWVKTASRRVKVGAIAGSLRVNKKHIRNHSIVSINRQHYIISRVIWVLHHRHLCESMVIDHVDGNPWNNNILNLRAISQSENQRNQKKFNTNTSGITGVARYTDSRGYSYFMSTFSDGFGKNKQKAFNIVTHGEENALVLAKEWRTNGLKVLEEFGIFYSSRHGT
jgi:hypothetical protein